MAELDLQTDRPHSARIYDYVLGGKDNYAPDREAAEAMLRANPSARTGMRANRAFMHRIGRHLAREHGVRQFLDLGTGIPTSPNLHEVVQEFAPASRVVYVDNDPIVLAHARALLLSTPEGRTAYMDSDLRDPAAILGAPELKATFDLTEPVALLMIGVVHVLVDAEAYPLVARLMEALPAGSYLAMQVLTGDFDPESMAAAQQVYRERGEMMELRTRAGAERFFSGLELIEPGIVQIQKWHPDHVDVGAVADTDVGAYGGVGRKA